MSRDGILKEQAARTVGGGGAAQHRLVSVTRGDCVQADRLMRRDARRVGLDKADDKVGGVDGSEWIKNQIECQRIPLDDLGLVKGRGMRWDGDKAESIMAEEALEQGGGWKDYGEAQRFLPA